MRRRLPPLGLFALLGLVAVLGRVSGSSAAPTPAWGTAVEVPGTAALNSGGSATVNSISCATTGNCTAGIVNTTNTVANLHIETSSTGSGGLVLAGGGHAYMTILAPETSVTITGGSFFGTLFAGTVRLTGNTAFHADTN